MFSEKILTIYIHCLSMKKCYIKRNNTSSLQKNWEALIEHWFSPCISLCFIHVSIFFSLRLSTSVPWKEHICTLISWLSVCFSCCHSPSAFFLLSRQDDAVLYISTLLCCETSFSPPRTPFLFPSSSQNMSYLGAFQTVRYISLRAVLA